MAVENEIFLERQIKDLEEQLRIATARIMSLKHQPAELQRVSERLRKPVIDFCRKHPSFRASELREYVERTLGQPIAPGSADRTLRALRSLGVLDYCVTNRRSGTYEVLSA
jgi:hypothetical protein